MIWNFLLNFDISIHWLTHSRKPSGRTFKCLYFGIFIAIVFFFEFPTVHILNWTLDHIGVHTFVMTGRNERGCRTGSHPAVQGLVKNCAGSYIAPRYCRYVLIRTSMVVYWFQKSCRTAVALDLMLRFYLVHGSWFEEKLLCGLKLTQWLTIV